jgi:DNA polymerase III subunit delta'
MWQGIEGHDVVMERFRRSLARGRLASTFLFVGPPGVGKRTFAYALAKSLLCSANREAELASCGKCNSCVQVDAGTHPDLIVIAKPADKSEIPVSVFIGEKDGRMRTGLCHDIALRPFMGGRKVAIIDDADSLNEEGANCLLKTLEEPPPQSVLILIGTSVDKQLPTIRSRSQIIRFQPLTSETVARLLQTIHGISDPAEAERLAAFSEGSLERALELADEGLWAFRKQLLGVLSRPRLDGVGFAKPLLAFIDEAGKEATPRRRRTKQVIGLATEFYRQLLRGNAGLPTQGDEELTRVVKHVLQTGAIDHETIANRVERCLDAMEYVDRNANQATLVETWLDELSRSGFPA